MKLNQLSVSSQPIAEEINNYLYNHPTFFISNINVLTESLLSANYQKYELMLRFMAPKSGGVKKLIQVLNQVKYDDKPIQKNREFFENLFKLLNIDNKKDLKTTIINDLKKVLRNSTEALGRGGFSPKERPSPPPTGRYSNNSLQSATLTNSLDEISNIANALKLGSINTMDGISKLIEHIKILYASANKPAVESFYRDIHKQILSEVNWKQIAQNVSQHFPSSPDYRYKQLVKTQKSNIQSNIKISELIVRVTLERMYQYFEKKLATLTRKDSGEIITPGMLLRTYKIYMRSLAQKSPNPKYRNTMLTIHRLFAK